MGLLRFAGGCTLSWRVRVQGSGTQARLQDLLKDPAVCAAAAPGLLRALLEQLTSKFLLQATR